MRNFFTYLSFAALVIAGSSCSDATGNLVGGESLYTTAAAGTAVTEEGGTTTTPEAGATTLCPSGTVNTFAGSAMPEWHDLYSCYFASCGTGGLSCHGASGDIGTASSGFICGADAPSCWTGITQTSVAVFQPLVPMGGTASPATAPLFAALHVANPAPGAPNNMPLSPVYTFSLQDIASLEAWIQGGAKNN